MVLSRWHVLLFSLSLSFGVLHVAPPIAANGQPRLVTVNNGRPLATVITELEQRHGWVVTYEDPPYEFDGDIDDVTESVRRDFSPGAKSRVLVSRTKAFMFEYGNGTEQVTPAGVLSALLEDYHRHFSNVSTFRLLQTSGDVFHVVPETSAGRDGNPLTRRPQLDTRISIEDGERDGLAMLKAITEAVSSSQGSETPIAPGMVPLNLLAQTKIYGGARNEVARDVLTRTLAATGARLSWKLFCQPGWNQCALNVNAVKGTSR